MLTRSSFDAEDKTIADILFANHEFKFRVPKYQRPYAWDQDQILEFYEDITKSDSFFFLGTFVFSNESLSAEKVLDIIDGQQRLLTITILMSVLRDIARELGNIDLSNRIQTKCIAFEDSRGRQTYRLICGDSLATFFEKYIQQFNPEKFPEKIVRTEQKLVISNYLLFKESISRELESETDKIEFIHKIWDKIASTNTIWVSIGTDVDAYMIFETVNARGVELSVADLLKNLIFQKTQLEGKDLNYAREKWSTVENFVATAKLYDESHLLFSKFLRHFWLSKYSYITERKLYKEIKNTIKNYTGFLDTLEDTARWYYMINNDKSRDMWVEVENGDKVFRILEGIRAMRSTQSNVIFLCLLRNLGKLKFDVSHYFEIIEKFTFVYFTISRQPASRVEQLYSRAAQDVENVLQGKNLKERDRKLHSILDKLIQELKKLKPPYPIFEENFKTVRYSTSGSAIALIRYILSKVNEYYGSGELRVDFNTVNIEHVLPKKPNTEWERSSKEISSYVNLLGNLTLVSKRINSRAGNTLKGKITELETSEIFLTKKIAEDIRSNNYQWDQKHIEKRQKELARIAYDFIWSY